MNVDLARIFIAWPILSALPAFVAYAHLLKRSGLAREELGVPAVALALLTGVLIAFMRLYLLERSRARTFAAAPQRLDGHPSWAGGRLRTGAEPLRSPIDGEPCAIAAWSITVPRRNAKESIVAECTALCAAVLTSPQGTVALQGKPDVAELHWQLGKDPAVLARVARSLLEHWNAGAARETAGAQPPVVHWIRVSTQALPTVPWQALATRYEAGERDGPVRQLAESLHAADGIFRVAHLPLDAEVTAFGRWRSAQGALDVGAEPGRWHGLIACPAAMLVARAKRRMRVALSAVVVLATTVAGALAWLTGFIAR